MRRSSPLPSGSVSRPDLFCRLSVRLTTLGLGAMLCAAAVAPALSGCSGSGAASSPLAPVAETPGASATHVASALRAETRRWAGTPYRMGGTSRHGIDCSGFVQHLFAQALGVDLSRSTRTQVREGQRISKSDLRPGDLVFFRPTRKVRHVGVYVGRGEFAHASTSAGPTVSPLGRAYWEDTYWTARRVLRLDRTAPGGGSAPATPPSERTGW